MRIAATAKQFKKQALNQRKTHFDQYRKGRLNNNKSNHKAMQNKHFKVYQLKDQLKWNLLDKPIALKAKVWASDLWYS